LLPSPLLVWHAFRRTFPRSRFEPPPAAGEPADLITYGKPCPRGRKNGYLRAISGP
jgi:hypothetical protein